MRFIKLLLNLPREAKLNATKPIRKYTVDDSNKHAENNNPLHEENNIIINIHNEPANKGKYSIPLVFCFIIFICFVGNIILTFFQLENVQTYNQKFYFLSNWVLLGRYRKVLIIYDED